MNQTEVTLLIFLFTCIAIMLIVTSFIRKKIQTDTLNKFKNLEQADSFKEKINSLKNEIDKANHSTLEEKISERIEFYISDAIKRSGSVTKGKVIEHFAPFLTNDILNPNEIVFMGSPIDLISFTNIDNDNELSIDFLEIKSGNSTLNKKQKLIRSAVTAQRVYYKKVELK